MVTHKWVFPICMSSYMYNQFIGWQIITQPQLDKDKRLAIFEVDGDKVNPSQVTSQVLTFCEKNLLPFKIESYADGDWFQSYLYAATSTGYKANHMHKDELYIPMEHMAAMYDQMTPEGVKEQFMLDWNLLKAKKEMILGNFTQAQQDDAGLFTISQLMDPENGTN